MKTWPLQRLFPEESDDGEPEEPPDLDELLFPSVTKTPSITKTSSLGAALTGVLYGGGGDLAAAAIRFSTGESGWRRCLNPPPSGD